MLYFYIAFLINLTLNASNNLPKIDLSKIKKHLEEKSLQNELKTKKLKTKINPYNEAQKKFYKKFPKKNIFLNSQLTLMGDKKFIHPHYEWGIYLSIQSNKNNLKYLEIWIEQLSSIPNPSVLEKFLIKLIIKTFIKKMKYEQIEISNKLKMKLKNLNSKIKILEDETKLQEEELKNFNSIESFKRYAHPLMPRKTRWNALIKFIQNLDLFASNRQDNPEEERPWRFFLNDIFLSGYLVGLAPWPTECNYCVGTTLHDKYRLGYRDLELFHDYIQAFFPMATQGHANNWAPLLFFHFQINLKNNPVFLKLVQQYSRLTLLRFLDFLGQKISYQDKKLVLIQNQEKDLRKNQKKWLHRTHNYARLTRLLSYLKQIEMTTEMDALYLRLCDITALEIEDDFEHAQTLLEVFESNTEKPPFWKNVMAERFEIDGRFKEKTDKAIEKLKEIISQKKKNDFPTYDPNYKDEDMFKIEIDNSGLFNLDMTDI